MNYLVYIRIFEQKLRNLTISLNLERKETFYHLIIVIRHFLILFLKKN